MDDDGIIGKMRSLFFGTLRKWLYVAVAVPGTVIAYNIIKALEEKGFFTSFKETVSEVISDVTHLSFKCPSVIHDFNQFTECLGF